MTSMGYRRESSFGSRIINTRSSTQCGQHRQGFGALIGLSNRKAIHGSFFYSVLLLTMLVAAPQVAMAELLWSGDFNNGTFSSTAVNPNSITFHGTPAYGRPVQYGGQHDLHVGNGELMWLTAATTGSGYKAGPRRGNNPHALALFVKSQAGGGMEPPIRHECRACEMVCQTDLGDVACGL